LSISTSKNA